MSEAAAPCFKIFSQNSLVSICGAVLTSVEYLTGLWKIHSIFPQYTTPREQLIDALRQFMCLYFLYQNGFFTISGNPHNF